MASLSSQLPDTIEDGEDIARFLTQSSHFNNQRVNPSAFLPDSSRESSVSRHGRVPIQDLCSLGLVAAGSRKLYGAAMLFARDIRAASLEVVPDEPPERHAVVRGWPWMDSDPEMQKARQKERALELASAAGEPLLFNEGSAWTSESPTPSPTASPA